MRCADLSEMLKTFSIAALFFLSLGLLLASGQLPFAG